MTYLKYIYRKFMLKIYVTVLYDTNSYVKFMLKIYVIILYDTNMIYLTI